MHRDSDFSELYAAVEQRIMGTTGGPLLTTKFDLLPCEPETVGIPEGKFRMGCPDGLGIQKYDEQDVVLPSFRIGLNLVTNFQYQEFIGKKSKQVRPAMQWKGQLIPDGMENEPVLGVTWEDAMEFCAWLSEVTRKNYSLPNEAQWEKACRGPYPCAENMGKTLEWTCSLWGETRSTPKYKTPWTNADGRNDTSAQSRLRRDLRVLRGYPGADDTGVRRSCARYGRSVDDSGFGDTRYGFRVILTL
jgi:formylglycine-generating enzyme required for sulfatase activity